MYPRPPMAVLVSLLVVFFLPSLASAASATAYPPDAVDELAATSRANLATYLDGQPPSTHNCTLATAARRFEWFRLPIPHPPFPFWGVLHLPLPPSPLTKIPPLVPGAT